MTKSNYVSASSEKVVSDENANSSVSTYQNMTNQKRIVTLHKTLKDLLPTVLQSGFYGETTISFKIQDGIIQIIRSSVEEWHN